MGPENPPLVSRLITRLRTQGLTASDRGFNGERERGKQLNKQISALTKTEETSAKICVCARARACGSDPDAAPMSSVALTGVRAPLIKETMHWQVASLPTLVIGPLLSTLSPLETHPSHPFLSFSGPCFAPPIPHSQKRASGQAETRDFVK